MREGEQRDAGKGTATKNFLEIVANGLEESTAAETSFQKFKKESPVAPASRSMEEQLKVVAYMAWFAFQQSKCTFKDAGFVKPSKDA